MDAFPNIDIYPDPGSDAEFPRKYSAHYSVGPRKIEHIHELKEAST